MLETTLEKYYVKDTGVRREIRSSVPVDFDSLIALVSGGQSSFQLIQGVVLVTNKIEDLTEYVGMLVRQQQESNKVLKATSDSQMRILNVIDEIVNRLNRLETEKDDG
jgi:hypothetical protein